MNSYTLSLVSGFSITLAAIIGLVRFRKILSSYRPFIFIVWIAFLNEIVSALVIRFTGSNTINGNIYVLMESLLFVWLFSNWGAMQKRKWFIPTILILLTCIWIYNSFILYSITEYSPIFRIFSSFILIFLSIDQINKLIVQELGNILHNPKFLVCIGVIIYHTYRAIMEIFFLKVGTSANFVGHIFSILDYVNLLVNLIFALAVLWIPTRQKFTLPS
jgi:hypothetical protein